MEIGINVVKFLTNLRNARNISLLDKEAVVKEANAQGLKEVALWISSNPELFDIFIFEGPSAFKIVKK